MAYQIWAFDQTGEKAAVLEKAFGISLTKEANAAPALSFSIPSDDAKTSFITTAYEIKVYNTIKSRFEGLFVLEDATDQWSSSGKYIACKYNGAMGQLTDEENVSYDTGATPLTPTSWFWEFGDGSNSTLQNPNHTYTRSGFRTVNLTATNSAGSNVTTRLKFVKVS